MRPRSFALEKLAMHASDRFERGLAKLAEIDGDAGHRVIEGLADIAPDLGRYIVEFAFGDIYSRPGLDLRTRELVTVAALTAMGTAQPQLEVHLHAALRVGCTQGELVEVILQMSAYAGFPAALNGIAVLRRVLGTQHVDGRSKQPAVDTMPPGAARADVQ